LARPVSITQGPTGSSAWQVLNSAIAPFQVSFQYTVTPAATGPTGTFSIDLTNQTPLQSIPASGSYGYSPTTPTPAAYNPTGFSNLSASGVAYLINQPALAWRLTVPTGTNTVRVDVVQAGIRS
jgi:hypothetical protein